MLGHPRKEIKDHFSEITEFSQINGYINAPLRTYSNGMIARLGFAVATSWPPDILILDEILAVGDEEFKEKCFSRINSFRSAGSTILLVTHDLKTILSECDRAVWLDKGTIQEIGLVKTATDAYLESMNRMGENGFGG